MIKSVKVTNHINESILLELTSPEKSGLIVLDIIGLGPSTTNINSTEMATNDGSVFNSARIESRNIVFTLKPLQNPSVENNRLKTYRYFPAKEKITLTFETENRIAEITGYRESNEPSIFSSAETIQISIICPDPFFRAAGESGLITTVFYGIEPLFEFPFSNESLTEPLLEFSAIKTQTMDTVVYDGDVETGITIKINASGDARNITIYNVTTRETMVLNTDKIKAITGNEIIARDEIEICTIKGQKSIRLLRDGKYYNLLNALDKRTTWFQLIKGDNLFAYEAEEGLENLQFKIEHRNLYEGI